MAGTKTKQRNKNRFRKVYPYIRRRPRYELVSDSEFTIEVGELAFTNSSASTHTFSQTFSSVPTITAISVDSSSNNTADVNVFVSSVTTAAVTIKTSQTFTGTVHFHAILVGS